MKRLTRIASALAISLAALAPVLNAGNGAGPAANILAGPCESISGTVMEVGYNGNGYVVDTGAEPVNVFGIGPSRYWDDMGMALPQVGEPITVEVCWITFSDRTSKAIATSASIAGTEIVLRDADTGQPAWRRGPGSNGGNQVQAAIGGGNQVQAAAGGGAQVQAAVGGGAQVQAQPGCARTP